MDRADLIRKVQLLLNGAAGRKAIGSMAEAEAFAAKAQQLLMEHGLSMTEVEAAASAQTDPMGETRTAPRRNGQQVYRSVPPWQRTLADAICFSYGGCVLTLYNTSSMIFVGRESARPVMVYVYEQLLEAARRLLRTARKEYNARRGYVEPGFEGSYMIGFSAAIKERLVAERKAMEDRIHAQAKAERKEQQVGTALARVNNEAALAKAWAKATYFPEDTPEEVAAREAERHVHQQAVARAEALEAERRASLTPAQRAKEDAQQRRAEARDDQRAEREWQRSREQEHRQQRRNDQLYGDSEARAQGYQDGKRIAITKGVGGGSGAPTKHVGGN